MTSLPATPTQPRTPTTPSTPRTPGFSTKTPTIKRILQESRELASALDPALHAAPLDNDLFEWHFTLAGPPSTPYASGIYHGRIILPPSYPLRPPSFRFLTPSGRFEVNREICLSISGHHEETWQPAWGIRTALCAIRAFMAGEAKGQVGGLDMNIKGRESLAVESRKWRCVGGCGGRANEEILQECEKEWRANGGADQDGASQVPEELRLQYRDDLERGPPTPTGGANSGSGTRDGSSSPLLAGPAASLLTRSKPPPSPLRATISSSDSPSRPTSIPPSASTPAMASSSSSRPTTVAMASSVPPTPAVIPPTPSSAAGNQVRQRPTVSAEAEGIPSWVDKAIVGVMIALALMLIRRMMG